MGAIVALGILAAYHINGLESSGWTQLRSGGLSGLSNDALLRNVALGGDFSAEMNALARAVQDNKDKLRGGPLDPLVHERIQAQIQKDTFAFNQLGLKMNIALRPERITVERVLTISPDLKVNVDVPPARIDLTAQLTYAALALGGLGILAAGIVAAAIHAHTRSRYKTILATAAARAARTPIGDSTWQAIIEQIVVDAANRAIRVERFLGMSSTWIRFSDRAGQRVTLGTSRAALRAAGSPGGRRINPLGNPFAVAQLHGVWRYFASQSNTVRVLPIDCVWWLMVEPVENQSTALTQVPHQTRLGMAWDHLRGRTRMRVLVHREVPTP